MATYKYPKYIERIDNAAFDGEHNPGAQTPFSGIYRCLGCGLEVVSEQGKPLPPQTHHQHSMQQGGIRWRLIAYADHQQKHDQSE